MKKLLLGAAACMLTVGAMNAQTVKDPATYPVVDGYQITNLWIQSGSMNNKPEILNETQASRGMAILNGKIYITHREGNGGGDGIGSLLVFDATTGAYEKKITLPDEVAKAEGGYACNDVEVDDAGHLLVSNMTTGLGKVPLSIWSINPETGAVIKQVLKFQDMLYDGQRIDYFDVCGDITGTGVIMAPVSGAKTVGGDKVFRWEFTNGVAGDVMKVKPAEYFPSSTAVDNNTAPRVSLMGDGSMFYLDGFTSWPTLYDVDGNTVQSFESPGVDEAFKPAAPAANGVDEFTIGKDNFVTYISTNTNGTPQLAWNVCKMGEGATFTGMSLIAALPKGGLGGETNPGRSALPRVSVKNGVAYIYLFATNNGMAAYKMEKVGGAGVESSAADNFSIVARDGKIVLSENADVEVYSIAGQKMSTAANAMEMNAPANKGIYLVKAILANGTQKVQKIVVE